MRLTVIWEMILTSPNPNQDRTICAICGARGRKHWRAFGPSGVPTRKSRHLGQTVVQKASGIQVERGPDFHFDTANAQLTFHHVFFLDSSHWINSWISQNILKVFTSYFSSLKSPFRSPGFLTFCRETFLRLLSWPVVTHEGHMVRAVTHHNVEHYYICSRLQPRREKLQLVVWFELAAWKKDKVMNIFVIIAYSWWNSPF